MGKERGRGKERGKKEMRINGKGGKDGIRIEWEVRRNILEEGGGKGCGWKGVKGLLLQKLNKTRRRIFSC